MDDIRNYKLKYLNHDLIINLSYSLFRYIGSVIVLHNYEKEQRLRCASAIATFPAT